MGMVVGGQSAQAADLNLRETWDELVSHVKGLGQHAVSKMKELANHVSNETLQMMINALGSGDTNPTLRKRQLELKDTWLDLVNHLKGLSQHAVDKLKEMANTVSSATLAKLIESLKTGNNVALKKREIFEDIEQVVAKLKARYPKYAAKIQELKDRYPKVAEEVLSRYEELKERLPVVVVKVLDLQKQVTDRLQGHADKLKDILGKSANQIKDIIEQAKNGGAKAKLAEIFGKIKATVGLTKRNIDFVAREIENDLAGRFINEFEDYLRDQVPGVVGGRDTEKIRRATKNQFTDFFKPHIEKLKQHVDNIGKTASSHAGNIHTTLKGHITELQGKLQGHVDEMKGHGQKMVGHGKNAVTALKNAVTQILGQTFIDMAGTTMDALGTISSAVGVIAEHVAGATQPDKSTN